MNCCTRISPWPSLHSTSLSLCNLHFLQNPPLHTSFHFISQIFWWFTPHLHFSLITFLTLSLILLGLQVRIPKASASSWFLSGMVLFTKEYFSISLLRFLLLISSHDRPCSLQMAFVIYHLQPSKHVLPCILWRQHIIRAIYLCCAKVSQFKHFCDVQI
jgi:hypothetical protein